MTKKVHKYAIIRRIDCSTKNTPRKMYKQNMSTEIYEINK